MRCGGLTLTEVRFSIPLILLSVAFATALAAYDIQPYEKVVTPEAKTAPGLFTVHRIGERCLYEIPDKELDTEFLWNTRIARTTDGVGFAGTLVANFVVRWQRAGNRILLRAVNYDVTADPHGPLAEAVKAANTDTIVMSFDIEALSQDGAAVIDVGRLFTSDVAAFGLRARLGAAGLDGSRTFLDRATPYPQNIEVEATETWFRYDGAVQPGQMRPGDATIVVHHSMVKLPATPMMARFYDDRVGYFLSAPYYYAEGQQRAEQRAMIHRRRLEKKDPAAAISEPVKPIVYYIDAATPVKWREWIRKGVEEWLPAFEAAGFRNAIQARPAPTAAEDPAYSTEDIRYSTIRWLPSATQNAFGPNVIDPRTGEILNADIEFYQNMMNLARNWCFIQTAALDPGARKLPLSDEAMGRAIQMVVAHEVGHTLGLEHNLKASSLYPAEKVRDRDWVHTMGFTPSIMDYARFDYVAQPEDAIAPEDLAAHVGPYDRWAIHWGYAPIPGAATPEDEKRTLDSWTREQDRNPWLRYTTLVGWVYGADTGELAEAVGDADAVASTALGLKNLKRVEKLLIPAATAQTGEPLDRLSELYGVLVGQWTTELNHVVAIVGGSVSQAKNAGQQGQVFTPIPAERQKQAVEFLNRNAFATPEWLLDAEVLRRIESSGALSRIRAAQAGVLNNLLDSGRFSRIVEQEAMNRASAWSAAAFLAAVRGGIWSELTRPPVKIDAYRRGLQRAYLDLALARVNGANTEEKAMYRAEMQSLAAAIDKALPGAREAATRAHLKATRAEIEEALHPHR